MARAGSYVRTIDHGWQRIQRAAKSLATSKHFVKAGVLGSKAQEERDEAHVANGGSQWEPMTNVKLALIHEFGTKDGRIPERSFIRSSFRKHRRSYEALLARLIGDSVFAGKITFDVALGLVGQKMASDMRQGIRDFIPPPNAPSTLARKLALTRPGAKGAPIPLIDTGRLLASITYGIGHGIEAGIKVVG